MEMPKFHFVKLVRMIAIYIHSRIYPHAYIYIYDSIYNIHTYMMHTYIFGDEAKSWILTLLLSKIKPAVLLVIFASNLARSSPDVLACNSAISFLALCEVRASQA